ncbi:hypothetical protein GCM10010967_12410 [Dyadobacter beijingensis]|uniref:Auto-transporter adhesin head GIN domain-containing protein n=1 Tax=Dyadobacter beijingensis TaxID=365489 RepID=A0ABQ2HHU3_9BACT|nr:DUF2807 domain-containing protein [Dyadobacter beijingensis]GGM82252.1 hypothetical protein GCM10010967_12410 [Dyadobacter beijingensis]
MKTSNILLIITLSVFFLVTLSSNFILKNKFDKVDKNDRFHGYSKHPVGAFKYVHLKGKGFALTEIQQGTTPQIRMITLSKYIEYKNVGDTLVLNYKPDWKQMYTGRDASYLAASIYIITPKLEGIINDSIQTKVNGFKFDSLTIRQNGDALIIQNSSVSSLKARIAHKGYLRFDQRSRVETADIDIIDQSTFNTEKDIFGDVNPVIDSAAYISLPGSMLKKLIKNNKITPR